MTNKPQDPAAPELSAEELDLAVGGASPGGPNRSVEMEQKAISAREGDKEVLSFKKQMAIAVTKLRLPNGSV